jgi:hypothetical protein
MKALGDLGIDGRIALKWSLQNWNMTAFKFLMWLGIVTSGGRLWMQ